MKVKWLKDPATKERVYPVTHSKTVIVDDDGKTLDKLIDEGLGGEITWDNIKDKPESFPPSEHTHSIDDINDLSNQLSNKYEKLENGISKDDLSEDVKVSLGKADTALQEFTETDPTVPSHVKAITAENITNWNNKAEQSDIPDVSGFALISESGYDLGLSIDSKTYVMTLELKNKAGTVLSTKTLDFPIESMVVNASYEDGIITLTLQNGSTLPVDISALVGGLVNDSFTIAGIDMKDNITAAELKTALGIPSSYAPTDAQKNVQSDWNVTDENSDTFIKNKPSIPNEVTESTVSGWGFTKNTGTYSKPSGGIPASDLASGVIPTSLPANGGNSATVNNHSVNADVPSGAKFTDTTYSVATASANGLMSSGDKTKISRIFNGHASKTGDSVGWYKININSEKGWMLAFTVRLYQGYNYYDIVFSGYQYGSNHWYSPNAIMLGSTATSINVKFGYDADKKLWVAVQDASYTGIDIFDVTNGFTQIDDTANLFTITNLATLTGTVQKEMTVYRPINKNEIQMSTTDLTAGTSALATGTVYIVYE